VIPVGVDQDPHIRLARVVASRFSDKFKFVLPSSTYHRLLPGLTGEKMSSSKPETAIFLTDKPDEVERKIRDAFTGGQPTAREQRKLGGDPDKCVVFGIYTYHLVPDDKKLLELRKGCKSGEIICGDCKKQAIELMQEFLKTHQEKYKRVHERAEKIAK